MDRPPAALVAEVAAAIQAEQQAVHALRLARARVVEALRALRAAGVPATTGALARAMHLPATTAMRRCLAHRLRQRLHRVTHRDASLPSPSGGAGTPALPSGKEDAPMAQIVRKTEKTVTTDYLADDNEEIDDVETDGDDEDDGEAEEETESKRTRRGAKRR